MNNERAIILQMLESGKISVDDALKLIEAIKDETPAPQKSSFLENIELDEKINKLSNNAESFAKDIGVKVNETWKDVEPKVKNVTKTAIEKTVSAIDKLSAAFGDTLRSFETTEEEPCDECNEEDEVENTEQVQQDENTTVATNEENVVAEDVNEDDTKEN